MPSPPYGLIYLLTNLVNGKYYVGQTRNLKRRIGAHRSSRNKCPISNAIRKHGWGNFSVSILTESSREDIDALESAWIIVTSAAQPGIGYNVRYGGNETTFTAATRQRMSEAQKRNPNRFWLGKKRPDTSERNKQIFTGRPAWNSGKKTGPTRNSKKHSFDGDLVRRLILDGNSQYSVAKQIHVHPSMISRFLRGGRSQYQ